MLYEVGISLRIEAKDEEEAKEAFCQHLTKWLNVGSSGIKVKELKG